MERRAVFWVSFSLSAQRGGTLNTHRRETDGLSVLEAKRKLAPPSLSKPRAGRCLHAVVSHLHSLVHDREGNPMPTPPYLQGVDAELLRAEGETEASNRSSTQVALQVEEALADENRRWSRGSHRSRLRGRISGHRPLPLPGWPRLSLLFSGRHPLPLFGWPRLLFVFCSFFVVTLPQV